MSGVDRMARVDESVIVCWSDSFKDEHDKKAALLQASLQQIYNASNGMPMR